MNLRDYQIKALNNAIKNFRKSLRMKKIFKIFGENK